MSQPDDKPKLIEIADGLYVRQEIDNIGWADMGDGLLVVDALEHAELEEEVFDMMERTVPRKKVKTVLNTHTHYDHVALNRIFEKKHGADIVNHDTRSIPEDGLTFQGGDRTCRFIPLPGGHTDKDCIAWFPEDNALFVGDLFGWGLITCMTSAMPEVMAGLESLYNRMIDFEAATVIPGHGPLCTTEHLVRCREYHDWLADTVYAGVEDGKSIADLKSEIKVPDDMQDWWRLVEWKHEQNISKLVKGARKGRRSME